MDEKQRTVITPAGKGCTFLVRVQFRQNATWQGTIQWLDGKKSRHFRSLMELAMLMQEAMSEAGAAAGFRSWTDKEEVS